MRPPADSSAPITIAHLSDLRLTATDDGRRKSKILEASVRRVKGIS
jgi:hypothetical protein